MHVLDPASKEELDRLCAEGGDSEERLRQAVKRVCADPSGRREPHHNFTKPFHNPRRYVKVGKHVKVIEFKSNQWRGLLQLVEVTKNGKTHRLVFFNPIKGQRFFSADQCPWH